MGWLASLTAWFSNVFQLIDSSTKALFRLMLNHIYVFILPGFAILKIVFDFVNEVFNFITTKISALSSFSADGSGLGLYDALRFLNYVYPVDETLIAISVLFTFFVGCQTIATIRGIKQTILF